MDEYVREAKRISEKFGVKYPLRKEDTDELVFTHYEEMKSLLKIRSDIENKVYMDNVNNISRDKIYCVFDGKLFGPFSTFDQSYLFVHNNATLHPMQPLTFMGNA